MDNTLIALLLATALIFMATSFFGMAHIDQSLPYAERYKQAQKLLTTGTGCVLWFLTSAIVFAWMIYGIHWLTQITVTINW